MKLSDIEIRPDGQPKYELNRYNAYCRKCGREIAAVRDVSSSQAEEWIKLMIKGKTCPHDWKLSIIRNSLTG